jgi:hypothetical protein
MKKNSLRTSAFGVIVGLALATGLGVGVTVLGASVSTPVAEQNAICPLPDKPASCPISSEAQAKVSKKCCPGKTSI